MKKLLSLIVLLFAISFGSTITDISDEDAIRTALNKRDDFFTRHLGNFQRDGLPSNTIIRNRLKENKNDSSVWYNYLMAVSSSNPKQQAMYYDRALNATKGNIGELWVLFLEFHKNGIREYEETILDSLETIALQAGVEVLPIISQQLELLSSTEYARSNYEQALFYLTHSTRFSRSPLPAEFSKLSIPTTDQKLYTIQDKFNEQLKSSWRSQTALIKEVLDGIFSFVSIITIILFAVLLFKYYPRAIHNITCLYPKSVPYQMRFFFTTLLLLVSLVFGVYPIVMLIVILMLRVQLSGAAKLSVRILLVLLLLYPFGTFVNSRLTYVLSNKSPVSLYERALREQPTAELYTSIKTKAEQEGEIADEVRALHYTSLALIQFKRGSTNSAVALIRKAYALWPESEPVLTAAGNIYHKYGDSERAFQLFKKAIELFPESPQLNYNYGQINLKQVGITDGTDFINKGAELAPHTVNGFINRNSHFFGESKWPFTRFFFLGTFSTQTFWSNFWIFSNPPKGTVALFWGSSFFGLPVFVTFGVLILALIISSLIVPSYTEVKKSGECVLCGKAICKKCRVNDICNECHLMLHNITNENLIDSIKVKLSVTKRNYILWKAHICDILFPGTRDLFLKKKSKKRVYTLIPVTILLYTYYAIISGIEFNVISQISLRYTLILIAPGIIYNFIFLITNVKQVIANIKKGGK